MDFTARYSRQIMLGEIGIEGQRKLAGASVLLVGAGGLGSAIALYLTGAGIGRLGIVDGDTVSESNLQRQVLYTEQEVGQPKSDCARRRLQALSSATQIDVYPFFLTRENALPVIRQYDIVVDGCDNYATRYLLDDCCREAGIPYVYGSIGEFRGQVSVFNYRGGMHYRDLFPDEQGQTSQPKTVGGVLGVVPGIVGAAEAAEVIKIVTGCGEPLRNKLFTIDVLTMQTDIFEF